MQCMFKFYLQIFTGVQFGFLVSRSRCPTCKQFRPRSYESCPHFWSPPLLLSVPVLLPKIAGRGGTRTLSLKYPHTEKSRGVKPGD